MFVPPGDNPRCATYVRQLLKLHLRITAHEKSGFLAVVVRLNNMDLEILNVYASRAEEATKFLTQHTPQSNTIMAGDFNSHHAMLYADKSTEYENSIHNSRTNATFLTAWADTQSFQLINIPELLPTSRIPPHTAQASSTSPSTGAKQSTYAKAGPTTPDQEATPTTPPRLQH